MGRLPVWGHIAWKSQGFNTTNIFCHTVPATWAAPQKRRKVARCVFYDFNWTYMLTKCFECSMCCSPIKDSVWWKSSHFKMLKVIIESESHTSPCLLSSAPTKAAPGLLGPEWCRTLISVFGTTCVDTISWCQNGCFEKHPLSFQPWNYWR